MTGSGMAARHRPGGTGPARSATSPPRASAGTPSRDRSRAPRPRRRRVGSGWVHTSTSVEPGSLQPGAGVVRAWRTASGPTRSVPVDRTASIRPAMLPCRPALGHERRARAHHRGQVGEEPVVVEHPVEGGRGQHGVDGVRRSPRTAGESSRRSPSTKRTCAAEAAPGAGGPRRASTGARVEGHRPGPPAARSSSISVTRPLPPRRRARSRRRAGRGGRARPRPSASWGRRCGRRWRRPSRRARAARSGCRRRAGRARSRRVGVGAVAPLGHLGQAALAPRARSPAHRRGPAWRARRGPRRRRGAGSAGPPTGRGRGSRLPSRRRRPLGLVVGLRRRRSRPRRSPPVPAAGPRRAGPAGVTTTAARSGSGRAFHDEPTSRTSSAGSSDRKRLGMAWLVEPHSVRLQAWVRYSWRRARVMPT